MAGLSSPTTLGDIPPHIIRNHILPLLDGPSLSSAAAASSCLCSDADLWSHICRSTWPSVTHPRVDSVISAFPAGHRSFFQDAFPALITQDNPCSDRQPACHSALPSQIISVVEIRYQNKIVYSRVNFTDTTTNFLSSALWMDMKDDPPASGISRPMDLKVDELSGADDATLSHLKESLTLDWILIDPTRRRAGNLSSTKPVVVKKQWITNEIHLRYITVLPGCDPNEMAQCRIQVTCAAGKGGEGLQVREVVLHLEDTEGRCLNGKEFLVITGRAISEENNVRRRRKTVGGEERERRYEEFKEMRRERRRRVEEDGKKRELLVKVNSAVILASLALSLYSGSLLFL